MHLIGTPCSESLLSIRSNVEEDQIIEFTIETDEPIIILYKPIVLKSVKEDILYFRLLISYQFLYCVLHSSCAINTIE